MQLPDMDFYIPNKAFTFKFAFSLDSEAIVAAEQSEFGNVAGAQALAALSRGDTGVAGCGQEAVQERRL